MLPQDVMWLSCRQTSTGGPDGAAAAAGTLTQYDVALPLQQQLEATSNSQVWSPRCEATSDYMVCHFVTRSVA